MRNPKIFVSLLILMMSCVSRSEFERIKQVHSKEITELKEQLDECQNGPSRTLEKMKVSFDHKDYEEVKKQFAIMESRHGDTYQFDEAKEINSEVLKIEEKEKQKKLAALKKLRKIKDDVSGITWYYNPYFIHYNNSTSTSVYFGSNDNNVWLRLKMSYYGRDWIFFEKAFLSYDGNTMEFIFDEYSDKETENSGGSVWEWIDIRVETSSQIIFLKKLANSKNAKMRLSGKYQEDKNLNWNERQGILDVINGYEILKSTK